MNQYELENAISKVYGYYIPRPNESVDDGFARAKAECIENYRRAMSHIEALTPEQFRRNLVIA